MGMSDRPTVILSGFADEAANSKTAVEQLAVCAAIGLEYYSLRFIDVGGGVKNVMKLTDEELTKLANLHADYDIKVASIGSPIGKVKLLDVDDGSKNIFIPFHRYLEEDVMHAIRLAHRFDTKLVRGFSFYAPRGDDPHRHLPKAVEQLTMIAERCRREGVVFGLEIEANLVGCNGATLAEIYRQIDSPNLVLIFDGGNISTQNLPAHRCFEEYREMRDGIGWMHIKDYRIDPSLVWHGHVDEDRLKNFVPADEGDSGHEQILRDFRGVLPDRTRRLQALGAPGVFLDLEPHLKGGGQFGGFSGPDGFGVALRALCRLLDYVGIDYRLRDFARLKR
jgi:sugar phosphate isomerase/epimerase